MADVKTVGRGIEAGVNRARLFGEPGREAGIVGCLMNQVTPAEIVEKHFRIVQAHSVCRSCIRVRVNAAASAHGVCLLHQRQRLSSGERVIESRRASAWAEL